MIIEGVFAGERADFALDSAVLYIGSGPANPSGFWLLEYTPENQRHLENHLRKAERLPGLSDLCPSFPLHHFTMTRAARFYVAVDPLPQAKLSRGLLQEKELIAVFERVLRDLKALGVHVRHM